MTFRLCRYALITGLAAALVAACGGVSSNPPSNSISESLRRQPPPSTYEVLHSFPGPTGRGRGPEAPLYAYSSTLLYGTTTDEGNYLKGSVFSISTSGTEQGLYSFGSGSDGAYPVAGLTGNGSLLFGTTDEGGTKGDGTVFSITPSGTETVLHSFGNGNDGSFPSANVILVGSTLYGTTQEGGVQGYGTVFSISTSGTGEQILHSFGGSTGDGMDPVATLHYMSSTLYGTTEEGGAHGDGTVFSISTSGSAYKILHSFGSPGDGMGPAAALSAASGTLYGTTQEGGAHGDGTVFSITTSGLEKVLHSFAGSPDGKYPFAALVNDNGTLYGTTNSGGAYGYGTIFSITTSGTETVLHSFGNGTDGKYPAAIMRTVSGSSTLYGTTQYGGATGNGTVFAFTP